MENSRNAEQNETQEGSEKVLLRVILQRHGPKLSASGEKNEVASYFGASVERGFDGMDVKDGEGLIHITSSPIARALETANIELKKIAKTEHRRKGKVDVKGGLATPFNESLVEKYRQDLKKIVGLQSSLEPSVRQRIETEHPEFTPEEKETEIRNLIDMEVLNVLFDENKAEEMGIQTSYEEVADNLKTRYEGFLRHTQLLDSLKEKSTLQPENEPYMQIDVSHSFPIMSLLKRFLVFEDGTVAKDLSSKDFFDKIGGVIRESGSLELDYELEGDGYIIKAKGAFTPQKFFSGQLSFKE